MNKEHPNVAVLKKFNPNNVNTFSEVLAKDAVWHYFNPQLPDVESDYVGIDGFKTFFKTMAERSKGTFKVNPISAIPFGDELVVAHVLDEINLEGKQMQIDAVTVWRIVNGKITEGWDIPAVNTVKVLNTIQK